MKVNELEGIVARTSPDYSTTTLGSLEYRGTVGGIVDKTSGREFKFTEEGLNNFASYLTVPPKLFERLSEGLRTEVVTHLLSKWSSSPVVLSSLADSLWNLYPQKTVIVPNRKIAEVVTRVFDGEATVSKSDFFEGMKLNIQTAQYAVEPKVGDVTNGGIRFYAPVGEIPYVSAYLERLVCSNGMITAQETDAITIRGRTVDEVIQEMEYMARKILATDVPRYLDNWSTMTDLRTNNPEQLIHRLTREAGVSAKVESSIIERAAGLESNTYYDIVNLITSLQHEEGLSDTQYNRLQLLGGSAVRDLGGHRCNNCQHNLD